jgi:osmoprotectant transport system ATP-binding protein
MSGDPAELRRGIGYVIQQAGLFPHRTILDNVATVPLLLGWNKATARERAAELMELVGLAPEMAKRYPSQLSGGQQQRVGVARALAADPPVLLMDEPFSAVDPVVRESLQDELLRLQSELGKTIVFVTHDIDEAIKLGDRVAVFRVDGLTIGELRTVRVGERTPSGGWALVVDEARRPLGWVDGARFAGTVAAAADVQPGGSLYDTEADSLRGALDAALSSPSGLGVAVDGSGAVVGSVTADDVLLRLAAARADDAA